LGLKKIVLAGGVFDIIHPGHIHTLTAAKALGDVLVVAIATDKTAQKMKKMQPLHNQELRCELVNSLSMVDEAIIGHEENIFETVKEVKPDIIALGYDQIHQEKFISDGCKRINLDVQIVRLQSPIPKLSSSEIEKRYGKDIHGL
jgi:cytidyltransferase-like protein